MTTDFELVTAVKQVHIAPCFRCARSFDLLSAAHCKCIARERTFACPFCASCACAASHRERNEFWVTAPPGLWKRRYQENLEGFARLQSLDPATLPRPFALIVDDDPMILTIGERALREMGFTTLTTSSAEEAYAIARTILPDVLLTDALMPKLDGRLLCLKLKGDVETRAIKIIVMSALYRGTAYRNEAFRKFSVDEYLDKPVKPGVLREAVNRLLPDVARRHPHSNDVRAAS